MSDLCISLSAVKPGFLPAAGALNRNGDDKVCKSENPKISNDDFEAFVNTVRITPEVEKAPSVEIPEVVAIPGMSGKAIMTRELTVGQFKQFVDETGYKIEDHNAEELINILKTGKAKDSLTYVSLLDARAYAKWLCDKTGRKFRVQTEAEWLQAKDQLSGGNWTWTETKYSRNSFGRVLRHLDDGSRGVSGVPEGRYGSGAVRLVEDK